MTVIATKAKVDKYTYGTDGQYLKINLRMKSNRGSVERNFFDLYDSGSEVFVIVSDKPTDWNRVTDAVKVLYHAMKDVPDDAKEKVKMTPEDIALVRSFIGE
jgi:hypothetical protein